MIRLRFSVTICLAFATGCSSRSQTSARETCTVPQQVAASQLDIQPTLIVPRLEHDLVFEFSDSSISDRWGDGVIARGIADPTFAHLLAESIQIYAGKYLLFEFSSSAELKVGACRLLEADLGFDQPPVRTYYVDVDVVADA
jgi:hypothetical protein